MNYNVNEEKFFSDKVDNQLVFIEMETFVYYTFNDGGSAVVSDLLAGHSLEKIIVKLCEIVGEEDTHISEKVTTFVTSLCENKILIESEPTDAPTEEMETAKLDKSNAVFEMDQYADVAEYFAADPIHEVNPQMGWPHQKED